MYLAQRGAFLAILGIASLGVPRLWADQNMGCLVGVPFSANILNIPFPKRYPGFAESRLNLISLVAFPASGNVKDIDSGLNWIDNQ